MTRRATERPPRLALFTHDTFGLGHVRRCRHLIEEIARRSPESSILLITGSPALHALGGLPQNADYLKLPTVARTGAQSERPPHLPLPLAELTSMRERLVREGLDAFRPDVFLVDNFPLGSRKELVPALERLRELGVPAVLGLRDIVDLPDVVRRNWTKDGIYAALERYYDRILIYGLPEVLDVRAAYALSPRLGEKLTYCGYITAAPTTPRSPAELGLEPPVVLATVGGGGDGFPLLSTFVRAACRLRVSALAITGPLMPARQRQEIRELAAGHRAIVVREFVPDLPGQMAAADLVVAMGGYNTAAELLALGRRALLMPRNWRYGEQARGTAAGMEWEQVLRVRALERIGLAEEIDPHGMDDATLAARIARALAAPSPPPTRRLDVGGVTRAVDRLFELVGQQRAHGGSLRPAAELVEREAIP